METVLVVGGSRGIGKATVKSLTQKYNVAFTYCKSKEEALIIKKNTPGSTAFFCDVESMESVEVLKNHCYERFGKIDHIIYCAGIAESRLFIDLTEKDWLRMQNININGLFRVLSVFLKDMVKRKSGSIIAVSSVWGVVGASMESHYSASKASIIGLTKSLAKEYALSNIRFNCISPGAIYTDMLSKFSEQELSDMANDIPLGRIGDVSDVVSGILFLLNNNYVTGQNIIIDGGWTL